MTASPAPTHRSSAGPVPARDQIRWRIGRFVFDADQDLLAGPAGCVRLRPKAAALLRALAAQPDRVVSRDALMEAVWPGIAVTDDSITQCIVEIRRALGRDAAHLLPTFKRRGYLLAGPVRAESGPEPAVAAADPDTRLDALEARLALLEARLAQADRVSAGFTALIPSRAARPRPPRAPSAPRGA
ncbi:winged helix-turn-helix domain-containing protein [Falsiroseomonas oryzae]|uniref:winged helix-turn-helix domain-containing protein n=1 Tax=Falsiroseomonas oryzae TaxID=2766473 RepID=UPI0022EB5EBD|nr:winged helix-turn-helix domain-containing protein [Roseomonas sp. MO-31]